MQYFPKRVRNFFLHYWTYVDDGADVVESTRLGKAALFVAEIAFGIFCCVVTFPLALIGYCNGDG